MNRLAGRTVGVLLESDFFEPEIWYYGFRFAEEGATVRFLSRMWGQERITYLGHEYRAPFECTESFEGWTDEQIGELDALIVPSGMVSDRLRYTEDVTVLPPATDFLRRAFAQPGVLKGIICHGLWLVAPLPELVRGRPLVCHNNLHGDAVNMGARYVDADVVEDGDLVTARTGKHCHLFAAAIVERLAARTPVGAST